jgi:hypothetical protein
MFQSGSPGPTEKQISAGSALAGSPIQTQIQLSLSTTGYVRTHALAGIVSCPGISVHFPSGPNFIP